MSRTIQNDMGFDSATLQTFLDQVNRIFSILQVMLSSIGLLALFVASIGIVNTMLSKCDQFRGLNTAYSPLF